MTKIDVGALFLREKPERMMLALKTAGRPIYVAEISKEAESTYAHTLRVLAKLEELGLVGFEENGRVKLVTLTESGDALAEKLLDMMDVLELAEIGRAVEELYGKEVKGRLREDVNKEAVLNKLEQQAKRLERLSQGKPEVIEKLVKRRVKRIDDISREVKGLIVG